jgi:hypothetical protein
MIQHAVVLFVAIKILKALYDGVIGEYKNDRERELTVKTRR